MLHEILPEGAACPFDLQVTSLQAAWVDPRQYGTHSLKLRLWGLDSRVWSFKFRERVRWSFGFRGLELRA